MILKKYNFSIKSILNYIKNNINYKYKNIYKNIKILYNYYKIFLKKKEILNKKKNKKKIFYIIKFIKYNLYYIKNKIYILFFNISNIPDISTPQKNKEIKIVKYFKKNIIYKKDHINIGKKIGLDLNSVINISGKNYNIFNNKLAILYRSLCQFILDTHIKDHNYIEYNIPFLINNESLLYAGQLPKFKKNLFKIKNKNLYLIPTSEISLINIFKNKIINNLPLKLVSLTSCFRNENISYGKINKGLIRQHQFDKIELIQITDSNYSNIYLNNMINHVENILKKLKLSYRIILLSKKNLGFNSSKTYDIEVWFPYEKKYIEISSISNCKSFQSQKINIKYNFNNNLNYVHTLNASGLPIGRTLAAILENYQIKNGINIPKILIPYMKGVKKIYSL